MIFQPKYRANYVSNISPRFNRHHPGGRSWTLALLVAGLTLGCLNAWHWVSKEDQAMRDERENDDE